MPRVLGLDPAVDRPLVRYVRRSAAVMAGDQHRGAPLPALPAAARCPHALAGDWRLRGIPARDRSRAQVRSAALRGRAAREDDVRARDRSPHRRRSGGPGAALPQPPPRPRLQPGRGPGAPRRVAGRSRPRSRPEHAVTDRSPCRTASRERKRRLSSQSATSRHRRLCRAGGRCEYDRGNLGGVCACAARRGSQGSAGAHRSPSRVAAAVRMSAETSPFGRSPSRRSHCGSEACLR